MWYLNLRDDPNVLLLVGAEKFNARARTASPEERTRLWPLMAGIWPAYDDYQKKTSREIPVIIIERV
jgi:deazaflavin-dependent oxidoreductase (nitroreductase family)